MNVSVSKKSLSKFFRFELDDSVLEILLQDKTTRRNIKWATDSYEIFGARYMPDEPICLDQIKYPHHCVIRPRQMKSRIDQLNRSKKNAEVFTPVWICNAQNNLVDNAWFNRKHVFNVETKSGWRVVSTPVVFPEGKTWVDYVKSTRLEVSCGEAPYIVSRCDVVTGETIPVHRRIGMLDRKLRVISENIFDQQNWLFWAGEALKSVYGYDWQGDNVVLARCNVLHSVCDWFKAKFNASIPEDVVLEFAKIIAWNIWQMDGIKCVVPNSCENYTRIVDTLFGAVSEAKRCDGCNKKTIENHNGIYCKIMDWEKHKPILFKDLMEMYYE